MRAMNDALPLRQLPYEKAVDVWLIELNRPVSPGIDLDDFLSLDERGRAARFVHATDAFRFRLCRAFVRLGLAWYLNKAPLELTLTAGEYGKPFLSGPGSLYFNVSHSRELGLIAFTTFGEVGIDLEPIEQSIEAQEIASANFNGIEAGMIASAGTPLEQVRTFLHLWTRKEAVLKATGFGILRGLDSVDVSQPSANLVSIQDASGKFSETSWLVRDLELVGNFIGAVAAPVGDWVVRQWPIRADDLISLIGKPRLELL
jgi:4'-phosphopantetheinyl transferase